MEDRTILGGAKVKGNSSTKGATVTTPTKARVVAEGYVSRQGPYPRENSVGNTGIEKDDVKPASEEAAGVKSKAS